MVNFAAITSSTEFLKKNEKIRTRSKPDKLGTTRASYNCGRNAGFCYSCSGTLEEERIHRSV